MAKPKKVRLCIDFNTPLDLAQFVNTLRENRIIVEEAGAYRIGSLDFSPRRGGVGRSNTFLLMASSPQDDRERMTYLKETTV